MDYSERWMRAEIEAIPDGVYEFTEHMEDDGVVDQPVKFHVTVTVKGDELIVDWTGTDPQVRGPINATYGVTAGATYNAVFHVTDHHIPKNSGAYRPIRIIAPPGSAVNVVYPGPSVGGNTETHPKLADMVIAALAPALPERVAAAEGGTACNFLFGGVHPKTGDYYANYHLEGGGWGAKSYDDGNDAIIVKNGNCRNTPVEIFETRYPLRVMEYSLIEGSGGPGRMRGGLGTRRILRVQEGAEVTCNALFDRTKEGFGAFGLDGGGKGGRGAILVKRKGESEFRTFKEVFGTVSPVEVHEHRAEGRRRGAHRLAGRRRLRRRERARARPRRARHLRGLHHRGPGDCRVRLERRGMTLHAPQLITAARMLYAVWLPADPAAAAALVPDELTAREGAPVFINQYVVDDAAQTSSAGDHEGFGAYSLTYLGVELADLDTEAGTPGALVDALSRLLARDDRLRAGRAACPRRPVARSSTSRAAASSRRPGARAGRS